MHDHGIQLLSPDGAYTAHPEYPIDLTPDELRAIFRDMAFTRTPRGPSSAAAVRSNWTSPALVAA